MYKILTFIWLFHTLCILLLSFLFNEYFWDWCMSMYIDPALYFNFLVDEMHHNFTIDTVQLWTLLHISSLPLQDCISKTGDFGAMMYGHLLAFARSVQRLQQFISPALVCEFSVFHLFGNTWYCLSLSFLPVKCLIGVNWLWFILHFLDY